MSASPGAGDEAGVADIGGESTASACAESSAQATVSRGPASKPRCASGVHSPRMLRFEVFDVVGRRVATLVDARLEAGRHAARLDAGRLAAGVYVIRMSAGAFVATRRVVVD